MTAGFLITTASILAYMTGWFIAARIRGRNDIADVAWGLGFILAAAVSLLAGGTYPLRGLLVSGLVLVWGGRLAVHIHRRNRGRGEDPRYRKWREEWGRYATVRSFFQIFILQGALLLVISLPVIRVITAPDTSLTLMDFLGSSIWLIGFLFEAISDW